MAIVFLSIAIVFFQCKNDKAELMKPLPDVVSFSQHVIPIFNSYCNNPGCHTGTTPTGQLDLDDSVAYARLFARHEIDTLNPSGSWLYIQVNKTSGGMPRSGRMNDYNVKLILKWIQQKAKNN